MITEIIDCVIRTVLIPMLDQNNQPEYWMKNLRLEAKWLEMIGFYLNLMGAGRQEEGFSDDEIKKFHDLSSSFMEKWVDLPSTSKS